VCSGHGRCLGDNDGAFCECYYNSTHGYWGGSACAGCDTGFQGGECTISCPTSGGVICGGRGTCNAHGQCRDCTALPTDTARLWCGTACQQSGTTCLNFTNNCPAGFWGTNCVALCPGAHADGSHACFDRGTCNTDTGDCICDQGYALGDCSATCPTARIGFYEYVCAGHGACRASNDCLCINGWFGENCAGECPGGAANPCFGIGVCDRVTGDCVCPSGWAGTNCDIPCPGGVSSPCNNHGTCLRSAKCSCYDDKFRGHFMGPSCDACVSGFGADNCTARCSLQSTTVGTSCVCNPGIAGITCDIACPGFGTEGGLCSGHGTCRQGSTGDGVCECQQDWYGVNCATYCTVQGCREKGLVNPQCNTGNGTCECQDTATGRWSGPTCDACQTFYWGPFCTLLCPCNDHGSCDMNEGNCNCFDDDVRGHWGSFYCDVCASGYIGVDCKGQNIEFSTNNDRSVSIVLPVAVPAAPSVNFYDDVTGLLYTASTPILVVNTSAVPPVAVGVLELAEDNVVVDTAVIYNSTHLAFKLRPVAAGAPVRSQASATTWLLLPRGIEGVATAVAHHITEADVFEGAFVNRTQLVSAVFAVTQQYTGRRRLLQSPAPPVIAAEANITVVDTTAGIAISRRPGSTSLHVTHSTGASFALDMSSLFRSITGVKVQYASSPYSTPYLVVYGSEDGFTTLADFGSVSTLVTGPGWRVATIALPLARGVQTRPSDFTVFGPRTVSTEQCAATVSPSSKLATTVLRAQWCHTAADCTLHGNATVTCVALRDNGAVAIGFSAIARGVQRAGSLDAPTLSLPLRDTTRPLTVTAMAVDEAPDTLLAFAAINAVDEPSVLYKFRAATFLLTGALSLTRVANENELITGIVVLSDRHELHITVTTASSVSLRSMNIFGIRGISPAVVDAAGGTIVTVTGEGFDANLGSATPTCTFGDGAAVNATVIDNRTITCVAQKSITTGATCALLNFNVQLGNRSTATSNVPLLRPAAARLNRAVVDVTATAVTGTETVYAAAGSVTPIVVTGVGFVRSAWAACRIESSGQRSRTISTSDYLNTTAVTCTIPAWVGATHPPAYISYSHDGTIFSTVRAPFAIVGEAVGLAVRSPADGTVVRSSESMRVPYVVAHVVDAYGNSLMQLDAFAYRRIDVEAWYDGAASPIPWDTNQTTSSLMVVGGVARFDRLFLVRPKAQSVLLVLTSSLEGSYALSAEHWVTSVRLVVVVGSPTKVSLAQVNSTRTWFVGNSKANVLSPLPVMIITDAAGNQVLGEIHCRRRWC
jgi:hypothetical protein